MSHLDSYTFCIMHKIKIITQKWKKIHFLVIIISRYKYNHILFFSTLYHIYIIIGRLIFVCPDMSKTFNCLCIIFYMAYIISLVKYFVLILHILQKITDYNNRVLCSIVYILKTLIKVMHIAQRPCKLCSFD